MSNQNEIELINAANKECDRLLAKIDELEKKNRALENYKNQSYRIKNQRHEISNRLKENERLRALLEECWYRIPQIPINLKLLEKIQETLAVAKIQATPAADIKIQESEVSDETRRN